MKKKRIFLSGKFTDGKTIDIRRLKLIEERLTNLGFLVINPANNKLSALATWQMHLLEDLPQLFTCDAIFLVEDFAYSNNCTIEAFAASKMNIPKFIDSKEKTLTDLQLSNYLKNCANE